MSHGHGVGTNPPYTPGSRKLMAASPKNHPRMKRKPSEPSKIHAFEIQNVSIRFRVGFVFPH